MTNSSHAQYKIGQIVKFNLFQSEKHIYIGTIVGSDNRYNWNALEVEYLYKGAKDRVWISPSNVAPFTELERLIYG